LRKRAGGSTQRDGNSYCFIIFEQHRRHRGAGSHAVAAAEPRRCVDRISKLAQPLDISTHGSAADLQPVVQIARGPVATRL